MASVTISGLLKTYGNVTVVDGIDLEVRNGEFLTLLGPSGCGKTTTLRAIAGLVEIDGGSIFFDGKRMNDVPPHKRSTAMVFQSYALFPHMTVAENIDFGLRMRHVSGPERARRVNDAMALVGLSGLAERMPAHLSGGQQQRVALARAVVTEPAVLLFDEPLSNLDAKLREHLRIEIRDLQRRLGITSIYVTHDQAEAMVISDRIVVMNEGRIEQIGDPASIYRHPASSFTANFIGQANIIKAKVIGEVEGGWQLETSVGTLQSNRTSRPAGTDVLISWRPEALQPFRPGMANRIVGTVSHNIFMGNLTDLLLDVGGVRLRMQRPGSVPWQGGDVVELGLPAEAIEILR